jgi:hypothetical protein
MLINNIHFYRLQECITNSITHIGINAATISTVTVKVNIDAVAAIRVVANAETMVSKKEYKKIVYIIHFLLRNKKI